MQNQLWRDLFFGCSIHLPQQFHIFMHTRMKRESKSDLENNFSEAFFCSVVFNLENFKFQCNDEDIDGVRKKQSGMGMERFCIEKSRWDEKKKKNEKRKIGIACEFETSELEMQ